MLSTIVEEDCSDEYEFAWAEPDHYTDGRGTMNSSQILVHGDQKGKPSERVMFVFSLPNESKT